MIEQKVSMFENVTEITARLLMKTIKYVLLLISTFLLIFIWGEPFDLFNIIIRFLAIDPLSVFKIVMGKLAKIALVIGLGLLAVYLSRFFGDRIFSLVSDDNQMEISEKAARAKTLINVARNLIKIVVFLVVSFSILSELNINIAPLLTGAGIVGLAIGFGAQSLVKDFFSGFFILMENQYAVGDVIKTGDLAGLVEKITLRTTILRDLTGTVHTIPNGNISMVSNMTNKWSRTVLDISVAYKENVDTVLDVLRQIGDDLYQDELWRPLMIEKPAVLGVDKLGESGVVIKIIAATKPIKQWDVMREFNRRIKNRFDELGIEISIPYRKLFMGEEKKQRSSDN